MDSLTPSTPKAQVNAPLFPEARQARPAELDSTPRPSSAGIPSQRDEIGLVSSASSSSFESAQYSGNSSAGNANNGYASSQQLEESENGGNGELVGNGKNANGTKEAWRRRKQVLLTEARNQTLANLQLHGLRPPPPHSAAYSLDQQHQQQSSLQTPSGLIDSERPFLTSSVASSSLLPTQASLNSASAAGTGLFSTNLTAQHASHHSAILRWQDINIRNDMLRIIDQFLEEEGLSATRQAMAEEWKGKARQRDEAAIDAHKLRKHILDGDWEEVDNLLLTRPLVRGSNALKYAIYKQQYLELIEQHEYDKAFVFLNNRLRELEHYQPFAGEFRDLCYLLSNKSIGDAPSFKAWEGIRPAREALIAQFSGLLEQDHHSNLPSLDASDPDNDRVAPHVPPHRLKSLMHQAVAYQVEFSRYHPKNAPRIETLLYDYESFVCPNTVMSVFRGHRKNVKALAWVGLQGRSIASGSSDGTVRIWSTNSAQQEAVMEHGSRVWDVASTESGNLVASAGGHALVKLWDMSSKTCVANLGGDVRSSSGGPTATPTGDVYSCAFDGHGSQLLSGGYDKIVRLYDLTSGTLIKTFTGHGLGVSSVTFDPACRLAVTASKDCTIRLWDLTSGLCIRTVHGHLGECTSVELSESGREMLTSSKDNSSLLHDMRTLKPLQRFRGAQNTRANFIRASFAHNSLIASGSEDGTIFLWDQDSSECLQTLNGHALGAVYSARWNKAQSLLASCGDDGTVRTWVWDGANERAETAP